MENLSNHLRIEIDFLFNLQRLYHNFNLKICSTQLKLNFKTMKAFHVKKIFQYTKTISLIRKRNTLIFSLRWGTFWLFATIFVI